MAQTRKYYLKNNYLTLRSKVITIRDTLPYGHAPTYQISLTYLERQKKLWSEQASLRRSGRKNQTKTMSPFVRRGDITSNKNGLKQNVFQSYVLVYSFKYFFPS